MLSIRNLSHTYPDGKTGGIKALDGVSLDIPTGMYGLLGPNGAGKSTLMRTLATLQQPTEGVVIFDGVDVLKEPARLRRRLGYLPQDFGVYPRGSALDHLDHLAILKGLTNRKQRAAAVEHLLRQTNLLDVRHKRLAGFSGGMRQRFGIAQALLGQPQLIIVDEPSAGLDPQERNRFHNLLAEIGEEVVVILSTHIVADVADLCPRMAVIAQGRIVAEGRPAELVKSIAGKIWKKHVGKQELIHIAQNHQVLSSHLSGGQVSVRVKAAAAESRELADKGFENTPPTLEDHYFSVVGATLDHCHQAAA